VFARLDIVSLYPSSATILQWKDFFEVKISFARHFFGCYLHPLVSFTSPLMALNLEFFLKSKRFLHVSKDFLVNSHFSLCQSWEGETCTVTTL